MFQLEPIRVETRENFQLPSRCWVTPQSYSWMSPPLEWTLRQEDSCGMSSPESQRRESKVPSFSPPTRWRRLSIFLRESPSRSREWSSVSEVSNISRTSSERDTKSRSRQPSPPKSNSSKESIKLDINLTPSSRIPKSNRFYQPLTSNTWNNTSPRMVTDQPSTSSFRDRESLLSSW